MSFDLNLMIQILADSDKNDTKLVMEGTIVEKLECRPYADQTYMAMKTKAMAIASQPKHKVEQIDPVTKFKPISNHPQNVSLISFLALRSFVTNLNFLDRRRQEKEERRQKVAIRQNSRYGHTVQCIRETSVLQH